MKPLCKKKNTRCNKETFNGLWERQEHIMYLLIHKTYNKQPYTKYIRTNVKLRIRIDLSYTHHHHYHKLQHFAIHCWTTASPTRFHSSLFYTNYPTHFHHRGYFWNEMRQILHAVRSVHRNICTGDRWYSTTAHRIHSISISVIAIGKKIENQVKMEFGRHTCYGHMYCLSWWNVSKHNTDQKAKHQQKDRSLCAARLAPCTDITCNYLTRQKKLIRKS